LLPQYCLRGLRGHVANLLGSKPARSNIRLHLLRNHEGNAALFCILAANLKFRLKDQGYTVEQIENMALGEARKAALANRPPVCPEPPPAAEVESATALRAALTDTRSKFSFV
jgi:hypothetical protein